MKALDWGNVEEASGGSARQVATLVAGIGSDKAKEINKAIKDEEAREETREEARESRGEDALGTTARRGGDIDGPTRLPVGGRI